MGHNSPSARKHRALRFLAHLVQYKQYGPLVGPKEAHQPNPRWTPENTDKQPCSCYLSGACVCGRRPLPDGSDSR